MTLTSGEINRLNLPNLIFLFFFLNAANTYLDFPSYQYTPILFGSGLKTREIINLSLTLRIPNYYCNFLFFYLVNEKSKGVEYNSM